MARLRATWSIPLAIIWRSILVLATVAAVVGIAFSWGWLVAAGIAPLVLSALPCLAMCVLGLCMNKLIGRSCASAPAQSDMAGLVQSDNLSLTGAENASVTKWISCDASVAPERSGAIQANEKGESRA